nr:zinc finger CCCH domain-containing protein 11A-like isoform X2 [Onthophagus taurus]
MLANNYCLDNFFHKVTDMESPRKNNDCYFYYYSTCTKGDNCTFRHEPSALGCETTCQFWKEGKCINVRCNFRHMELRKNRKAIPCYWETQPGGCLKPHCPFLHQKRSPNMMNQGEGSVLKGVQDLNMQAIQSDSCAKNLNHGPEKNYGNAVDKPLVVNFEEESDNESAPTHSPVKTPHGVKVKTLEEIRLEKIQAESAAFYSYPEFEGTNDDLRERILKRITTKKSEENQNQQKPSIEVLTLTEIRKRKRLHFDPTNESLDDTLGKKQKVTIKVKKDDDFNIVKVKTLEEIRAERAKKLESERIDDGVMVETTTPKECGEDCEVSSTSKVGVESEMNDIKQTVKIQPIKRLKRPRIFESDEKNEESETKMIKIEEEKEIIDEEIDDKAIIKEKDSESILENNKALDTISSDSSKLDDVLLLDEDEFDIEGSTKPEEDILKDIDDILNE